MDMLLNSYYNILFDSKDTVCFGKNKYGTAIFDVRYWQCAQNDGYQFLSINPMHTSRADANVTTFRNILVEFDTLSFEDQRKMAETFPHSTCVYSGGKSFHYIISLETPCSDKKQYDSIVRRIYKKLPEADQQAKNASRFTRLPDGLRDNGVVQAIAYVTSRIPNALLEDWLGPEEVRERFLPEVEVFTADRILPGSTMNFLLKGAEEGSRNSQVFKHACEMIRAGYEVDDIIDRFSRVVTLPLKEIISAVKSAGKTTRGQ